MSDEPCGEISPAISIIVPVYNVERFLPACLESIAAQTMPDFECILVDDGSPDGSGALCDAWAKKGVHFSVIHQANAGVSAARNAGLDAARGEWITFVDSDDTIDSTYLEELYTCAKETGADYVMCGFSEESATGSIPKFPPEKVDLNHYSGYLFGKLARHTLFIENDIRFPDEIFMLEDQFVTAQLAYYAKNIHTIHKVLYRYTKLNPNAVTRGGELSVKREEGDFSVWYKVFDLYEKSPIVSPVRLNTMKLIAKEHLLMSSRLHNAARWRKTFPEANKWILRAELPLRKKVWGVLALLHLEGVAYAIQRIHHAGKIKR